MHPSRVVITGMGAISPVGNTLLSSWDALTSGRSGVDRISGFPADSLQSKIAGEIRDFVPEQWVNPRDAAYVDRAIPFASAAAKMALDDSGLLAAPEVREHTGVLIGTALGGIGLLLKQHKIFLNHGPKRVSPLVIPFGIPDMISAYISIAHQLRGPNHSIVSACASGANAIGEAYQLIRRREMVAMLAGGSEAINEFVVAGFCAARSLSTSNDMPQAASRPFDRSRNGFVMAEGAAVLVLESREHALARGAPIYAELVGYGSCSDGFHFTKPRPDGSGAMRAMEEAIRYAGIPLGEIDYINAHGTSTIDGDRHETEAVKALFGEQAKRIVISSTKSMTGHMLGAAGAFEAAVCVLAIRDGIAPPTINYRECDPECDLDFVPNVARHKEINVAVSNSFGFGGHNVSLVIKRHE